MSNPCLDEYSSRFFSVESCGVHASWREKDINMLGAVTKYLREQDPKMMGKVTKYLEALSFNNEGQLALIGSNLASRQWDGFLAVYSDPAFAPEVPHIDIRSSTDAGMSDVCWVDNKRLITASDTGGVDIWKILNDGKTLEKSLSLMEHDDICCSIELNNSHQQIISGSWDGSVKIWDLAVEVSVHTFQVHYDKVLSVSWSQTFHDLMTSASEDGNAYIFDTREVNPAQILLSEASAYPCAVNWHPNKAWVAVGYSNGSIAIIDTRNPNKCLTKFEVHTKPINRVAFSQGGGSLLASVSDDLSLNVQDCFSNSSLLKRKVHEDYIKGLAWDLKQDSCWTCGWDGKVVQTFVCRYNMELDL